MLYIPDINSPPLLKTLPLTVQVLEGTTIGTNIYKPLIEDGDLSDTHIFTVSYIPPEGAVYFKVNTTSKIH